MKRTLALILALLTLIGMLAGCAKEPAVTPDTGDTGKNDTPAAARQLSEVLNRKLRTRSSTMPIHVNLIPVNEVSESGFLHSDKDTVRRFASILEEHGIRATVRRTLGADINASCGQLRRAHEEEKS